MLSNYKRQLGLLLQEPDMQSMVTERQFAAMHRFFAYNPYYYSIYIYKKDGFVNATARRDLHQGITNFEHESDNILTTTDEKYKAVRETLSKVLKTGFILTARPRKSVLGFLDQIIINLAIVLVMSVLIAISLSFLLARSLGTRVGSLVEGIR